MTSGRIRRRRRLPIFLALCILTLCVGQVGARGPTISDIQPYDTIFVYEEGLNLTQLRKATTENPITALRKCPGRQPRKNAHKEYPRR